MGRYLLDPKKAYLNIRDWILGRRRKDPRHGEASVPIPMYRGGGLQVSVHPSGQTAGDRLAFHGCAYWQWDTCNGTTRWEAIHGTSVVAKDRALCAAEVRYHLLKYAAENRLVGPGKIVEPIENSMTYAGYMPIIRVQRMPLPQTFVQFDWRFNS
jgi:hypothetical protein